MTKDFGTRITDPKPLSFSAQPVVHCPRSVDGSRLRLRKRNGSLAGMQYIALPLNAFQYVASW